MSHPDHHVGLAEREALMLKPVTLNGRPAQVVGRLVDFAMVRTTEGDPPLQGEWAWATVRDVIEQRGGEFRL